MLTLGVSAALLALVQPSNALVQPARLARPRVLARTVCADHVRCSAADSVDSWYDAGLRLEAAPGAEAGGISAVDESFKARASEAAGAVYRFSRPHTIRGTLLACFTGVGRALIENPVSLAVLPAMLPRAGMGVLALLLGNLFIVGINQIYDVDIDVVNKPFLPIAAGRISPRAAWALVVGSGLAGLAIVKACFNPLIFYLYLFGTTIGGLYSVPPVQVSAALPAPLSRLAPCATPMAASLRARS